jgi:DNA-directed RNA polymerase subunit RPC12/RpoP
MMLKCKVCHKIFDFQKNYMVRLTYAKKDIIQMKIVIECPYCMMKYIKVLDDEPEKLREKLKQLKVL